MLQNFLKAVRITRFSASVIPRWRKDGKSLSLPCVGLLPVGFAPETVCRKCFQQFCNGSAARSQILTLCVAGVLLCVRGILVVFWWLCFGGGVLVGVFWYVLVNF